MRIILLFLSTFLAAAGAHAQCRIGSGPDHGDGIPYCDELSPPPQSSVPPTPPQWQDFAAAVVWADSDEGDQFDGVGKYFDEQMAIEQAMEKCRAKTSWRNCEIAVSTTNGVIAVGRDQNGKLRVRSSPAKEDAENGLIEECVEDGSRCKVVAIFDGRGEYF